MSRDPQMLLSIVLAVVGIGWWVGVDVWRGWSREHSRGVFWLHLTAPVVAIIFLLAAIALAVNSDTTRRARKSKQQERAMLRKSTPGGPSLAAQAIPVSAR